MAAGEQDGDVVARDEFRQSGRQLVGQRRRLVVLHVEVVQQLCRGGEPVAARTSDDRLDHARQSAAAGAADVHSPGNGGQVRQLLTHSRDPASRPKLVSRR